MKNIQNRGFKVTDLKNIKSIDLSSTTIIGTSISFIWSIIFVILLIIALSSILGRFDIGFGIIGIGIIFGTIILNISQFFGISFLYNLLIKKMKNVQVNIEDTDKITEISLSSLALIVGVISLIISIIVFPLIFLILSFIPIIIQFLQALSLQGFAWLVFPMNLVLTPLFILNAFVIVFVLTAVGAFIFNKVSPFLGGLKVSLSKEGNLTKIDSIEPKSAGIITGIICLIYGLLYWLLFSVVSGNLPNNLILIAGLAVGGLVGGFIYGDLSSVLYNLFAKKLDPVKLELETLE